MSKIRKPTPKPDDQRVRFSFDYLQPDHAKFPIGGCGQDFFVALFRQILRYQQCRIDQFKDMPNGDHRHPITFSETTEPDGFPNIEPADEDLWTDDPWQIGLGGVRGDASFGWRVHGFIAESTFYVVWLDPCHKLDSPVAQHNSTIDPLLSG